MGPEVAGIGGGIGVSAGIGIGSVAHLISNDTVSNELMTGSVLS
jgi:hypothetical protein